MLMQASSSLGLSSNTPSMVVSPSDSDTIEADPAANGDSHPGTNPVKADHSTNDSIRIGAGATSSSFPRSTLAGGAVFAGEPMPINDTQILSPRVSCKVQQTTIFVPLCILLCMSSTHMQHAMLELHMYRLVINRLLTCIHVVYQHTAPVLAWTALSCFQYAG